MKRFVKPIAVMEIGYGYGPHIVGIFRTSIEALAWCKSDAANWWTSKGKSLWIQARGVSAFRGER